MANDALRLWSTAPQEKAVDAFDRMSGGFDDMRPFSFSFYAVLSFWSAAHHHGER